MADVMADESQEIRCPQCLTVMIQEWWPKARRERTCWSDAESVVVFRKPDGSIDYPARNDKPTPAGYERIVMRSDREVARFERDHGVVNHRRHYDSNGRGIDDQMPSPRVSERINTF